MGCLQEVAVCSLICESHRNGQHLDSRTKMEVQVGGLWTGSSFCSERRMLSRQAVRPRAQNGRRCVQQAALRSASPGLCRAWKSVKPLRSPAAAAAALLAETSLFVLYTAAS